MDPMIYTDMAMEVYEQIVTDIQSDRKISYEIIAYLSMVSALGPLNLPAHLRKWLDERLSRIKDPPNNPMKS